MKKVAIVDISRWKRAKIKPFFPNESVYFLSHQSDLVEAFEKIVIWGRKEFNRIETFAKKKHIPIYRMEDGFIRSVSLGVDFSQPYSLIIDKRGIYFDATQESDLEYILSTYNFDESLLERAEKIRQYLVENKLSKYNIYDNRPIEIDNKAYARTILVIGQVEGDASLIYGADNMKNLELLQSVKRDNPNSYIIYKPHPDVLTGKREGNIVESRALNYCHQIEKEVGIDALLSLVDEVHTMTSLVGFEALLRGKNVVCYGMPFYAGWGLTIDKLKIERRTRKLKLLELVAGTYILYPKYIDPKTLQLCEIERVLEVLSKEKELYHNSLLYRVKIKIKNFLTIKYYAVLRHILKD